MNPQPLGWFGIFRLGLVQAAIGAIVVITTSTLNRVLVVELALPAMIPGALVALHYFVQILRPRLGYSSDIGGRRTPWIIGGMGVLGAVAHSPEQLEIDLRWIEDEIGDRPYGVDLIVPAKYAGSDNGGLTMADIVNLIPDEHRRFVNGYLFWHHVTRAI